MVKYFRVILFITKSKDLDWKYIQMEIFILAIIKKIKNMDLGFSFGLL
jgi:hypothetical protein